VETAKFISYRPIGLIHTPFKTIENIPIQNAGAKGQKGTIEIFNEFVPGLKDIQGFSHIILLYHFHKVNHYSTVVTPFMDNVEHGIFATRAPVRPNPIGLTVVKLIGMEENMLTIEDIDVLDNTPLLDIKPCLPMIDDIENLRLGWLTDKIQHFEGKLSDGRFKWSL
jgi:tRNA (adenine37-N6)-methyltransferase